MNSEYNNLVLFDVPITSIDYLGNFLIISGGGGGKKFGVKNFMNSYNVKNNLISKVVSFSHEFKTEIPNFIKAIKSFNLILVCLTNCISVFSMDLNTGSMNYLEDITITNYTTDEIYLSTLTLDSKNLIVGSSDGNVK